MPKQFKDILSNAVQAKTRLMEAFMADLNHTLSVEEITHLLHYEHTVAANGIVGQIGAQVYQRTGQPHPDGYAPGIFQPQSFITTRGKSRDSSYAFQLRPHIVEALRELNIGEVPGPVALPEELDPDSKEFFREGTVLSVWVTAYERSPQARLNCLGHYGYECACCGLNMKNHYALAEEFVHVHHLRPLATIGKSYKLDPILDLRPVCPNCHAVIHLSEPALTIVQVRMRSNIR